MVKGILKCYSSPRFQSTSEGPNDATLKPKRVSFDGAEPARVFQADEWDRSPAAVTLKLTYRDVVELRELNISLVNPSPLAMVRTPSRRPTKQRTPRSPSSDSSSSSSDTSQSPASPSPSFVPGRYLGPLLEDPASPSPTPRPKLPDSPPGLPAPLLKAIHSPTLPPPSPLVLPPPLSTSRPPSPKPTSMVSPVPLYRHPRHSARTPLHRATLSTISDNAPMEKSIVLPSLAKASSFEFNELKMKLDKLTIEDDDEDDEDKDNQQEWKSLGLVSEVAEDGSGVAPTPPPTPRKPARTLMGMWDFKRSSMGFGRAKKV